MDLSNKIVLVTGGSLGIGLAIAKLFKEKGAKVIITGRNKERLQSAAEEYNFDYYVSDVSIEEDVITLFDNIKRDFGKIDALINNAGYGYFDNMNDFFSHNGFVTVDRTDMDTNEISFSNVWGVCDEDLFNKVLKESDKSYQKNKPFFNIFYDILGIGSRPK